jgi:hypothetical protein
MTASPATSIAPGRNGLPGGAVRPASQAQPPPRKTAMVTQAARRACPRSAAGPARARPGAPRGRARHQAGERERAEGHPGEFGRREGGQRGGVRPERGDGQRGSPGERGHPAGHEAGPRPRVTAGAGPAVPEVPAADDHDREPGQEQRGRDGQGPRLAAGEPARHGPRHRQRGEQRQQGEDQDRSGHHERGHGGGRGVRRGPLPADDELGPDGAADAQEDGRAAGERRPGRPGPACGPVRATAAGSRTGRRRRAGRRARP